MSSKGGKRDLKTRFVGILLSVLGLCCGPVETEEAVIDLSEDSISFPATVSKETFESHSAMPGYHFVVWEGGRAGDGALFRSRVTDTQVLEAMESLGAQPGNALGLDVWDERENPSSKAPDQIIEGPRVEVLVRVPGRQEPLALDEILVDPGGRGFDMRFGGHRANIPRWKSGCMVCLYSCPGSKVGNARYTVRDFVEGTTRFSVREGSLPEDGTEVTIMFRLVEAHYVQQGNEAIGTLQTRLVAALTNELKKGGPASAVRVCRDEAQGITHQVAEEQGIAVGRTSHRLRNPVNVPRNWIAPFVDGGVGKRANEVEAHVVDLGDRVGVLKPIGTLELCTNCHGMEDEITPEVKAVLTDGYPDDRAVGFKVGDLRGWMWAEVPKGPDQE